MRTEKSLTALSLIALAVGALALSLAGCGTPTPDMDGDVPRDQVVPKEGKVYPLEIGPGEWLEYEIVSANNCQLIPATAAQQGDRVRFEIVGSGTRKKIGRDYCHTVFGIEVIYVL